eukprot:Lithocolla_globosa_v1_NODE_2838_length_1853_cov_5.808676.p4 type:complete len:110 gc:universal NODE_2838_length_1853_cov_5.808676:1071-742(-)
MLDVRMIHINNTIHSRHNFLFPIVVYFRVTQNRHGLSHLRHKRHRILATAFNQILGKRCARECDGNGHTDALRSWMFGEMIKVCFGIQAINVSRQVEWIRQHGIEMQCF